MQCENLSMEMGKLLILGQEGKGEKLVVFFESQSLLFLHCIKMECGVVHSAISSERLSAIFLDIVKAIIFHIIIFLQFSSYGIYRNILVSHNSFAWFKK